MTELADPRFDPRSEPPAEPRLSGAIRVFLGFLTGALVALIPMYYFYSGRDAPLQPDGEVQGAPAEPVHNGGAMADAGQLAARFAARMTYELSQLPDETRVAAAKAPVAAPVESAAPAPAAPALAPTRAAPASGEVPTSRVVAARPITATPPDARDTTVAIEKEALRPEYRETSRRAADGVQPRIIEGRDIVIPPKPAGTPTRPIVTSPAPGPRSESEADTKRSFDGFEAAIIAERKRAEAAGEAGPQVTGVTPIGPPPAERADTVKLVTRSPNPAEGARAAPSDIVDSRLAATREWLAGAPQNTHTIQIMGAGSEEQLRTQLRALSKTLDLARIYLFRTMAQGKPAMTVIYGAYADRQAAQQAIDQLPASVSANKPVLRTVNGIRTEMRQNAADNPEAAPKNGESSKPTKS